jgi:hypothetical protein
MTPLQRAIYEVGNYICYFGAIFCWLFVVLYGVISPWTKTEIGKHLMSMTFGMGLILSYVSIRILWPPTKLETYDLVARAVIFAIESGLAVWRFSILFRKQLSGRRRRGKKIAAKQNDRSGGRHTRKPGRTTGVDDAHK